MKRILVLSLASSLTACAGYGYHDAVKLQVAGIQMSATTGVIAGYVAGTVDRSANVDKSGKPIVIVGCSGKGQDSPDTYSNLNSKASASASTISNVSSAGINSPSIAWASGDTSANGAAAVVAAAATTAHPADTIASLCDNQQLPNAPPSSIVRDGVSPK